LLCYYKDDHLGAFVNLAFTVVPIVDC